VKACAFLTLLLVHLAYDVVIGEEVFLTCFSFMVTFHREVGRLILLV
jgi:hypothetical protein